MERNPYTDINPRDFEIRETRLGDTTMFVVVLHTHKAFPACVFRGHLVDFLMANMQAEWRAEPANGGNDLALFLGSAWDEQQLRDSFSVI